MIIFAPTAEKSGTTDHDFSLKHVLAEAAEAFFHVDSKIFLTLKTLVS